MENQLYYQIKHLGNKETNKCGILVENEEKSFANAFRN